jgi:diacylglycerol kinase family enzyme
MKAAVLVNCSAGTGASRLDQELVGRIAAACRELQLDAEVKAVASADLDRELDAAARQPETDTVIVGGGDGTIKAGAAALVRTGKALGVLPLGTLNHFARDLGIPARLEDALAAAATGPVRQVDVAEVNGHTFVNNCSIGLYAEAVLERERLRRYHGVAKWTAMARGAGQALRRFPVSRLRLRIPGSVLTVRTPQLVIGNNRYDTDLFALGKRDALDRGELWVYAALDRGRFGFLRLVLRAMLGRLDQGRDFYSLSAQDLEVERRHSQRRIRVALDGELTEMRGPLRFRVWPRALRVRVPAAAA